MSHKRILCWLYLLTIALKIMAYGAYIFIVVMKDKQGAFYKRGIFYGPLRRFYSPRNWLPLPENCTPLTPLDWLKIFLKTFFLELYLIPLRSGFQKLS